MSTLSGVFPNAITPSFAQSIDPAEQARLRRQSESAVFSPVEATEETTESRRSSVEQPGRLEADQGTEVASRLATRSNAQADDANVETAPSEVRRDPQTERRDDGRAIDRSAQNDRADQSQDIQQQRSEAQQQREQARLEEEIELVRELAARDREVRAHEQAHQSVGGQYAGAMEFTYKRGPDGQRYAVGGEVPIDVGKVPGDPQATLEKAEQVRRAALAPAEPSTQDRQVAALATQISIEAQNELRQLERQELEKAAEERAERREISDETDRKTEASSDTDTEKTAQAAEDNEERLSEIFERTSEAIESALDAAYRQQPREDIGFNLDTTV